MDEREEFLYPFLTKQRRWTPAARQALFRFGKPLHRHFTHHYDILDDTEALARLYAQYMEEEGGMKLPSSPLRNPLAPTLEEHLALGGDEETYWPNEQAAFSSVDAEPGSAKKRQELRERVHRGSPLWHPEDK